MHVRITHTKFPMNNGWYEGLPCAEVRITIGNLLLYALISDYGGRNPEGSQSYVSFSESGRDITRFVPAKKCDEYIALLKKAWADDRAATQAQGAAQ